MVDESGKWKVLYSVSLRDETRFYATVAFLEILDTYDVYFKATIAAHLKHFEQAWCNSNHDGDLPSSNQFEAYTDVRVLTD